MSKTLVCRCEDVTLHELETAMQRGHRDVESVKRYTGFGTGWCQGKWCLALCARLIDERGGDASEPFTARPPYRPVRLADLAGLGDLALSGKDSSEDAPEDPISLESSPERR
jgi:bacterioferritin-associated ferredoxin